MRQEILSLYHRLPNPMRSAAATARGVYLNLWRRGRSSQRLERAALERDTWSDAQWELWREEKLGELLNRAATRVPYYRAQWAARRRAGDDSPWDRLENWPILEKDVLREQPNAFVADDCSITRMFHEQTSGTTGKPIEIWRTRSTVQGLYALARARTLDWHKIPDGARYARLGGQLVTPVRQRKPPFWVWNSAMRQLYMSTYHLAPDLIPFYLDALKRHHITYLAGYPSSLAALARVALEQGRTDLRMLAAFTNAEPLTTEQRSLISAAFQCAVRETYGMAENVAAASECPAGRLHCWPEIGLIEVMSEDGPVAPGHSGDLVCTGLLNRDMPLIRYRVGDRGGLADPSFRCECGRTLPVIEGVDGRITDLLIARDGRQIFWLNPVFYGLPVRETQIVQESLDCVRVVIAPAAGFGAPAARTIVERLQQRMGDVEVVIDLVKDVPRTTAGKLRAVECRLSSSERESARKGAFRTATL
jgi:phenylacetate-CoA ligase